MCLTIRDPAAGELTVAQMLKLNGVPVQKPPLPKLPPQPPTVIVPPTLFPKRCPQLVWGSTVHTVSL